MQQNRFDSAAPPTAYRRNEPPNVHVVEVRKKYLHDWQNVKRARFNAAKRFERKQIASSLAFAGAGAVGFVVPFFSLLFKDALQPHTTNVVDFVAYITGALSVSVGLVEQAKGYPLLAIRFHTCGLDVNQVLRRLRNTPEPTQSELDEIVSQYERALEKCELNHDDIDSDIAYAQDALTQAKETKNATDVKEKQQELRSLRRKELVQIYWLYWAVWVAPTALGLFIWWCFQPTPVETGYIQDLGRLLANNVIPN